MKIALVCKNYLSTKGGLEQYTISLSRGLLQIGHEVHVFANKWQREPGVIFHHVPMVRFSSPGKNLSFAYFAERELSKEKFDVVQSMERILFQDIFRASDGINPVQMRERYSNPAVRKLKAMGPRRLALAFLEGRIFRNRGCRFVMTNSQLVKDQIIEYYQVNPEKIVVIYNSVDDTKFRPELKDVYRSAVRNKYGIRSDELLLLFVGNDFRRKGLQILLTAMTIRKNPWLRLMVVGSDRTAPYLRWAARNGLDKQVLFLGSHHDIHKFYAACDVFVLPTRYDAFANSCLEAMACGVPVITTCSNGASEIIENGKQGYLLRKWDPEELAERIRALECRTDRAAIGESGAIKAKNFTMASYMTQLTALYERVRTHKATS